MTLIVDHVNYIYDPDSPMAHKALDDICLTIPDGQFIGIIGHTGSGKSTLIQHLNGLLKPTSGQVLLDGVDIWSNKKWHFITFYFSSQLFDNFIGTYLKMKVNVVPNYYPVGWERQLIKEITNKTYNKGVNKC